MRSLTVAHARTPLVSEELVLFVGKLLMFHHCAVSTKLFGCCVLEQEKHHSEISNLLLNVWRMNWSMLQRYTLTAIHPFSTVHTVHKLWILTSQGQNFRSTQHRVNKVFFKKLPNLLFQVLVWEKHFLVLITVSHCRVLPTRMPSRRKMNWSEWPNLIVNLSSLTAMFCVLTE